MFKLVTVAVFAASVVFAPAVSADPSFCNLPPSACGAPGTRADNTVAPGGAPVGDQSKGGKGSVATQPGDPEPAEAPGGSPV